MPTPEEIARSIDERLLQAAEEIRQLEAARHALRETTPPRAARTPAPRAVRTPAARTPAARAPSPRAARASRVDDVASKPPRAAAGPKRRATPVDTEQIQRALASATDGLSAADITERTGADRPRVLTLLRESEASGQVRRSGERRTTRWHLITDEDRIAKRAAELAKLG